LIDFDLLYRYIFREDDNPEWEQQLHYLFSRTDTCFIIGPGTAFEINRFLYTSGYYVDSQGSLHGWSSRPRGIRGRQVDDDFKVAVFQLGRLLDRKNFIPYDELVTPPRVDVEAFATARAALDIRRGSAKSAANQSDALNWAAVIHLRRTQPPEDFKSYPYLLTGTNPLLDEKFWSPDIDTPVSRDLEETIYTEVVLATSSSAEEAARYADDMSFEAVKLARSLRSSPAYLSPTDYQVEPDWDEAIDQGRLSERLENQLSEFQRFVSDRIVKETQRIYDNAQLASVSSVQQRGAILASFEESPRKLFDLIVDINRAVTHRTEASGGLGDLWDTVLEIDPYHYPEYHEFRLVSKGSRNGVDAYLIADCYEGQRGSTERLYVWRWPSAADADHLISTFSYVFMSRRVKRVELYVGLRGGTVCEFSASVPTSLAEIVAAVRQKASLPRGASGRELGGGDISWLRMDSASFDLYADLVRDPSADPLIGVFGEALPAELIVDMYVRTSARYLFPAWLSQAVTHVTGALSNSDAGDIPTAAHADR
jgi:hypothetical protein